MSRACPTETNLFVMNPFALLYSAEDITGVFQNPVYIFVDILFLIPGTVHLENAF